MGDADPKNLISLGRYTEASEFLREFLVQCGTGLRIWLHLIYAMIYDSRDLAWVR